MDLQARILDDMKAAMKGRDKPRVAAIRLIRDAIQKDEIAKRKTLDDADVLKTLARLSKQRKESIEAFEKAGRDDLVEKEKQELAVISEFMPEPMSLEKLGGLVQEAISAVEAEGPSDMGKVMKALKGKYEGLIGGKEVSEEVKRRLAALSAS